MTNHLTRLSTWLLGALLLFGRTSATFAQQIPRGTKTVGGAFSFKNSLITSQTTYGKTVTTGKSRETGVAGNLLCSYAIFSNVFIGGGIEDYFFSTRSIEPRSIQNDYKGNGFSLSAFARAIAPLPGRLKPYLQVGLYNTWVNESEGTNRKYAYRETGLGLLPGFSFFNKDLNRSFDLCYKRLTYFSSDEDGSFRSEGFFAGYTLYF